MLLKQFVEMTFVLCALECMQKVLEEPQWWITTWLRQWYHDYTHDCLCSDLLLDCIKKCLYCSLSPLTKQTPHPILLPLRLPQH